VKALPDGGLVGFCHRVETEVDGGVHDGRLCDAGAVFFACEIKMTRILLGISIKPEMR